MIEVSIFQKKKQLFECFLSILFSIPFIVGPIIIWSTPHIENSNTSGFLLLLTNVLLALVFLYGLIELYSCIISVIYDWTTTITIDQKMQYVVYYNKYTGEIKFHTDDIVEVTHLSKNYPRMMLVYVRVLLRDGKKIIIGHFVDTCFITKLYLRNCKYEHAESAVYEDFLISMMHWKHNLSYTEKS